VQWEVASLGPKSTTVDDPGFTMIAVLPKFKLTLWWIYKLFDGNYVRQICVCLWTQFKHNQKWNESTCTYVLEKVLCTCVYDFTIIYGSCTDGVVYLVSFHYIWQLYWWYGICFYHYIGKLYWWCHIFNVLPLDMAAVLIVWCMILPLDMASALMVRYI
jgi:hypothetical protein